MLFDIGWPELMLIGAIALVVIGPKDLPRALRVAGFWVRKARTLSREFQSSIDQMIREAELDEMRQELKKATEFDLEKEFQKTVDPDGSLAESIKPPEIPDFFDNTPAAVGAVEAERHSILAPPGETATAEEAGSGDDPSQLALPLPGLSEPEVSPVAAPVTPQPAPPELAPTTPRPGHGGE
ncbi:MAG TPA: Sec-independent protein translocase protein TatB [Stellaceae bacterium]|jgi:sec-independent protein translocase protein TatB|nr:Sec-independent protein translocase protein TatB [Stellaceae bacterium]